MSFEAWLTFAVLGGCLATLIKTRIGPDLVMLAGLVVLLASGVLSPAEAFAGFANEGLLTIAVFYVIAAALRETGALEFIVQGVFGHSRRLPAAQLRMMIPVSFISAFVANTPVVASFLPAVMDWATRHGISPSKLMIPLSYAAILGGCLTLVGTSTNLVVNGLLLAEPSARGMAMFELAWVGLPCALVGLAYVVLATPWLLKDRIAPRQMLRDAREYTVEAVIPRGSPLAGRTVAQAGLRHLSGLYLVEIDRNGTLIPAVGPDERLQVGDHLVFAGITESVVDLQKIKGLAPADDQVFKLDAPDAARQLVEAVIGRHSPVAGRTIREARFRTLYGAVVMAVARDGERIRGKLGDIRLAPGDTLLLETDERFLGRYRNARDFLLLNRLGRAQPRRRRRAFVAWGVLAAIIAAAGLGRMPLLEVALIGAGVLVVTRCVSAERARNSIDLQVIVMVAAGLGISRAVERSGAGAAIADTLLGLAGTDPLALLIAIYLLTMLLTEIMTNAAAAVLMFPIALAASQAAGISIMPFAIGIAMAASASFATPIGYHTNLMVYGPGGYRFADYLMFGAPLNLLVAITTLLVIPRVWPF